MDASLTCSGISDGKRHELIKTKPDNSLSQPTDLIRRVDYIVGEIGRFIDEIWTDGSLLLVVEAPMLNAMAGASHLLEVGYLMSEIHRTYRNATVIEVPPTSLKKFATGKGNTKKADMPAAIKERWGIEFENDRGADRLHAYCLYRYGVAVLDGTHTHIPSKRRGHERAEKAERKRARNSRIGSPPNPSHPDRKTTSKRGT